MSRSASTIEREIDNFFGAHCSTIGKTICFSRENGKTYEVYCVTKLLEWIEGRYDVDITYCGKEEIKFRSKGGSVNRRKYPYFVIQDKQTKNVVELHTNIEVRTLGSVHTNQKPDNSFMHEIDIVLMDKDVRCGNIPNHDQVFLGIECKEYANLRKSVIREVLGVRRELSILISRSVDIVLDGILTSKGPSYRIPAKPSSLYWLACVDDRADRYASSPSAFGIEIQKWIPI